MIYCSVCGHPNPDTIVSCESCGSTLFISQSHYSSSQADHKKNIKSPPSPVIQYILPAVVFLIFSIPVAVTIVNGVDDIFTGAGVGYDETTRKSAAAVIGVLSTTLFGAIIGHFLPHPLTRNIYWRAAGIGIVLPIPSMFLSFIIYTILFASYENMGDFVLRIVFGPSMVLVGFGPLLIFPASIAASFIVTFIAKRL